MTPEPFLHRLRDDLSPENGQKERVRMRLQARIGESSILARAKEEASPATEQHGAVWNRIVHRIDVPEISGVLDRLKAFFDPSQAQQTLIRGRLMQRLAPVEVRTSFHRTKWTAAFVLVLVALRASPALFLAPHTVAESAVIVVPTKGGVELALHGLWQPATEEVTVNEPVQLRTDSGEATILLHDDGTIRLADETTVSLYDLSDRPEPALDGITLMLTSGRIWMQGLLPDHLRGIVVATPHGAVTVHGGSVSVSADEGDLIVRVWDRKATVTQGDRSVVLVAGERMRLSGDSAGQVSRIADAEFEEPWVVQNLRRDAVHQREIAQMQQERRAAQAGILPNSPLYAVKRVAERVDVLFTLDPETRLQKRLDLASTRLSEAAALIAEGSTGASIPLEEYKATLLALASGSGDSVTQFLLRQQLAENTADVSAALPDDEGYLLKKTLLETSAQLPLDGIDASDVAGVLLMDTLNALRQAIETGNTEAAKETFAAIEPYLETLGSGGTLKPDIRKEALNLLAQAAEKLTESASGSLTEDVATGLRPYLPQSAPQPVEVTPLTDEQIDSLIARIRQRVFVYDQQRPRRNQLILEMRKLEDHPDEGRILRRLYNEFSADNLGVYVRREIQELRNENLR